MNLRNNRKKKKDRMTALLRDWNLMPKSKTDTRSEQNVIANRKNIKRARNSPAAGVADSETNLRRSRRKKKKSMKTLLKECDLIVKPKKGCKSKQCNSGENKRNENRVETSINLPGFNLSERGMESKEDAGGNECNSDNEKAGSEGNKEKEEIEVEKAPKLKLTAIEALEIELTAIQAPEIEQRAVQAPEMQQGTVQMEQSALQALEVEQRAVQAPEMQEGTVQMEQSALQALELEQRAVQAPEMQEGTVQMEQTALQAPEIEQRAVQAPEMQLRAVQAPEMQQATVQMEQNALQALELEQRAVQAPKMHEGTVQMEQSAVQALELEERAVQAPEIQQSEVHEPEMEQSAVQEQEIEQAAVQAVAIEQATVPSLEVKQTGYQQKSGQSLKLKNPRLVIRKLDENIFRQHFTECPTSHCKNRRERKKGTKYNFRNSTLNDENRLYEEKLFGSDLSDLSSFYNSDGNLGSDSPFGSELETSVRRSERKRKRRQIFFVNNEPALSASSSNDDNSDSENDSPVMKKRKTAKKIIGSDDEDLRMRADELERNLLDLIQHGTAETNDERAINNALMWTKNQVKLLQVPVVVTKLQSSNLNENTSLNSCAPNGNDGSGRSDGNGSKSVSQSGNLSISPNASVKSTHRANRLELPSLDDFNEINVDNGAKRFELPDLNGEDINDIINGMDNSGFVKDIAENVTEVLEINKNFCRAYNIILKVENDKFITSHHKTFDDGTVETHIVEDFVDPALKKALKLHKYREKKKTPKKERRIYYKYIVKELDDGRRITELQLKTSKFKETEDSSVNEPSEDSILKDSTENEKVEDLFFDFDLTDYLIKKGEHELGLIDSFPYSSLDDNFLSVL